MTNAFWKRVRGGTPGSRVFAAYLALVLMVAMAGPGLAVYATESEVMEQEPVIEAPVIEAPVIEAPVVEEPVQLVEPEVLAASEPAPAVEPDVEESAESVVTVAAPLVAMSAGNSSAARPVCAGGVKLDGDPRTGTYTAASPKSVVTPTTPEDFEITITTYTTDDGMMFDFVSNYPVAHIAVKGGSDDDGYNDYYYDPPVYEGTGLHATVNPSGKYADISHIIFCFGTILPPETGDLIVYKFEDLNDNGKWDEGEPMLEDWAFALMDAEDVEIDSGLTDEDGELPFSELDPGGYSVTETLESGWRNTTPLTQGVTIVAGQTAELWFGNIREELPPETGDLVIHKFEDLNENGVWNEGEPMLEDWEFTVTLETPPIVNGVGSSAIMLIGSGLTDGDGELSFLGLDPAEYTVTETLQDGWTNTTPLVQKVTVVAGQTAHVWFGNVEEFLPFTELDLAILKVADKTTASEGDLITYTLTYWNLGDLPAENYMIVDDYDQRYVTPVSVAGGTVSGGKITWTFPGPLAKADGQKTITYTMRVIADMPDGTTNIDNVVVISHPLDFNPANNTDDWRVVVRVVDEPFLPFTGGEYLMLLGFAVAAAALGLLLRPRTDTAV